MTFAIGHSIPQTEPPRSPRETLPTMYDLPSEYIGEPGLPDEFHDLQPQLLSRTLSLVAYPRDQWFTGADLNLYYDVHHPLWYKRPDWFLAVGVPRLYNGQDFRRSYVTWQEGQNPYVVIEFLSSGTEREDLGRFYRAEDAVEGEDTASPPAIQSSETERPLAKFSVYEQQLRVPHYLVYSRQTQRLRYFQWVGGRYQEQQVNESNPQVWLADLNIGLGLWEGNFEGISSSWLRWCDEDGNWLLTDTEQERLEKEQERQAKEQAQAQVLQAAKNLLATGMTVVQVAELLGLSTEQVSSL
ncbi:MULTISPECIES: Uma2 family endonuclease [unclassified Coleofasciculus]|uniref:Uma2 family endonuclease n=1 Tax=unclassified Coleofasciculus TaxID=2692782 RepID=UPI001881FAEF|nr:MULTISPECIES: Uma2 family endonuclease [unclassified Coleofasciculus]MBE9126530.1 Uma2 family endonuclease [Coleofasciculus sp. LEGE 07081]MBE9149964.1 Uma2 family endonuclease [Coleofasciculus sp. LEGE 07092]